MKPFSPFIDRRGPFIQELNRDVLNEKDTANSEQLMAQRGHVRNTDN